MTIQCLRQWKVRPDVWVPVHMFTSDKGPVCSLHNIRSKSIFPYHFLNETFSVEITGFQIFWEASGREKKLDIKILHAGAYGRPRE